MLAGKAEYLELWQIVRLILVLSHGQASVERRFSVNDDILLTNMKEQTLCAMKTVCDVLKSMDIQVYEFVVTDKMLQYCSQARSKYSLHLDEVKAEKKRDTEKRKAAKAEGEYVKPKKRLKSLEEEANSCIAEADKKATSALKHDFKLLAQSVALRDKGKAMLGKEVQDQKDMVQDLQSKLVQ